jgi:hypothetical protein
MVMTITATQKAGIEEIIHILCTTTAPRGKRQLSGMFMDLVDREDWPQYYEASHLTMSTVQFLCSFVAYPRTTLFEQHPVKLGQKPLQGRVRCFHGPLTCVLERNVLQ